MRDWKRDARTVARRESVAVPHDVDHDIECEDLRERIHEVKLWAHSRIEECRRQELKFNPASDVSIRAATERQALQAVLRMLLP